MRFELEFHPSAWREWEKLDGTLRAQFKKKLGERLDSPLVPSARILGAPDLYKIKLRTAGYRLVYQVIANKVAVLVLSVGKRERNSAYIQALDRVSA
jgi:mRNA interferase RelE/StbE